MSKLTFLTTLWLYVLCSDKENLTLDLILKSSTQIRNTKVTIKFSIIKDSSPFKMVKKTHAYDNELAALEPKLS